MEAIMEHNAEAIRRMRWEGFDFEYREPEIRFERTRIHSEQRKQKSHVTAKQKKLMESERYLHTLP